jgi:hypothetical protein
MGCKYVKEFEFGGSAAGSKFVKGYYRGGKVAAGAEPGMKQAEPSAKAARGGKMGSAQPAMPRSMGADRAAPKVAPMRAPAVRRAKSVPVAPSTPMLAMKAGGSAKMRNC